MSRKQNVASELKDPICHSNECQIGSFSSEATKSKQQFVIGVILVNSNNHHAMVKISYAIQLKIASFASSTTLIVTAHFSSKQLLGLTYAVLKSKQLVFLAVAEAKSSYFTSKHAVTAVFFALQTIKGKQQ